MNASSGGLFSSFNRLLAHFRLALIGRDDRAFLLDRLLLILAAFLLSFETNKTKCVSMLDRDALFMLAQLMVIERHVCTYIANA